MFSLILLRVDMLSVPIHNFCTYLLPKNLLSNKKKRKKKCCFSAISKHELGSIMTLNLIGDSFGWPWERIAFTHAFTAPKFTRRESRFLVAQGLIPGTEPGLQTNMEKLFQTLDANKLVSRKKKSSDLKLPKVLNYALLPVFWFET